MRTIFDTRMMLVALGFAATLGFSSLTWAADRQASHYSGPAVSVTVAKRRCFTDTVDITGHLVPKQEILLRPEHEGYRISNVLVEVGDTVIAGQVLARLKPPAGQPGDSVAVRSTTAGLVGKVSAVVGTLTSLRAPPLFQIVVKGEIDLAADVPTGVISRLSPGQRAVIKVIGVGLVQGRVRFVSPTVDARTQFGSARIYIGDDKRLRIGTFGRASIMIGQSCGVAVPLSAVLYDTIGPIVEVVKNDRVVTRKVVIGLLSEGMVEIREGLSEGDQVVARAGAFLRDGDLVRPVTTQGPAGSDNGTNTGPH